MRLTYSLYLCTVVLMRCTCACEHLIPFKADLIRIMSVVMKNRACNLQSRRLQEVLKASRWKRFQTKERQKLENGAEGQWRGRKRGDRRGGSSFRVAMKTTEALHEFGNQWTLLYPPLLLYSSPSPSMWGKPPSVTVMRFPCVLTCSPLTPMQKVPFSYYSVLCGNFVQNKILFCKQYKDGTCCGVWEDEWEISGKWHWLLFSRNVIVCESGQ